ncbi:sodium- and chloride-dependent betaine transporter-like isoform X1 [Crassostrea angulata]|uniref:sodium- and chloride-dependent betaine transporter-like isoform X1 n=1 Tax=Magallana angulata TaxID=2784310 RepID=UPI0022B16070|nr:sodium- and chloride-dependent betaine transporter-like isoform X1 [Crassostrea angulata]XP_052714298.1 sodium- and chloride-dependent betaine transporter-like isoform X1 [Crassostrea angulata]XP_052714299.1 sodium- and chloride-dependent betaine transporter-like isoform X1 [Crassostrea angulata]
MSKETNVDTGVQENEPALLDSESNSSELPERALWSRKIEYLLSLFGYSVGLGNIWRFPYLCMRNGGGAFLIPFFICLIFCAVPLYFLEVSLGQFTGKSPVIVWSICPLFKGLGWLMMTISFIMTWYYNLVMSWVIYYFVHAFFPKIPWSTCDNWWNTDHCIVSHKDRLTLNKTADGVNQSFAGLLANESTISYKYNTTYVNRSLTYNTAAYEFWEFNVLRSSKGIEELGSVQWHLVLVLLAAWVLTFCCLIKGVRSLGKVVYVTVILPYILLAVILIRGLTLDGSTDGILFYIKPDFSKVFNFQVWLEAGMQVFYSLGVAWGGVITMSSYNRFTNQCIKDAWMGTLADGLTSFYAGFVVFSILGFMAKDVGLTMEEISISATGPGLVFVAYPEALMKLPMPHLWGVLFFFMLIAVGVDSQFANVETVSSGVADIFPKQLNSHRVLLTAFLCTIFFVLGIPLTTNGGIYIFQLIDWYAASLCITFAALSECIIISWIYGAERFNRDIEMMIGKSIPLIMRIGWCLITPIFMLALFLTICAKYGPPNSASYTYPDFAIAIGQFFAILPMLPVPIAIIWGLVHSEGTFLQRIKTLARPDSSWGPNSKRHWQTYKVYEYRGGVVDRIRVNLLGDRRR